MMWSEERIRELMSAARLREVNWDKQTPAERFSKNDVIFIIQVFDKPQMRGFPSSDTSVNILYYSGSVFSARRSRRVQG